MDFRPLFWLGIIFGVGGAVSVVVLLYWLLEVIDASGTTC